MMFQLPADDLKQTESGLSFALKHWCLWQSAPASAAKRWPNGTVLAGDQEADVSFLPMLQRRRLSPLAKAACAVAWHCRQQTGEMPTVFFSAHGESQYYFEMLQGMAAGEAVSPSRFSLCVHNAIAGLFSIQSDNTLPYVALAGGSEDLFGAFIEAAGLLLEVPQVMVVCYEQPLPAVYQAYATAGQITWAVAMVLGRNSASDCRLQLNRQVTATRKPCVNPAAVWLPAILEGRRNGSVELAQAVWHWSISDG